MSGDDNGIAKRRSVGWRRSGTAASYDIRGDEGYVRATVRDTNGKKVKFSSFRDKKILVLEFGACT